MFVTSLDLPLRGRERELAHIRDVMVHGCTEGSALLVIEGPPGSGKTRLLRACATMAQEMGYAMADRPYTGRREEFPRPRYKHGPFARHGLRSGRGRARADAGPPLLLLIDEADRLGVEALETLLARRAGLHGHHAVSVVAHRSGKGPESIGAVLATPTGRRDRLVLSPLAPAASALLTADVLGMPAAPSLLELVDQAEGLPRLIVALLTGLREEQGLRIADGEAHLADRRLPQRVRAEVAATMETFSPDLRQLLRMAAVLGRELEYEVLAPMLRTSPSGMVQLMDEAVATGAVHSDGVRTVFRSELLRRLIAGSVPASLKRALLREAQEARRPRVPAARTAASGAGHGPGPGPAYGDRSGSVALNDRRSAVVSLVAQGLTNQQIARRLEVSPHTVNYHLRKLFHSYGVRSRIDLLRAVEQQREAAPRLTG
ncbi:LuxR C-terminal-related transcriptional regulator [Streptomyces xanthophaeus]|uniref:LuxR C-terminal-related transcriptional regulator n=1 Tax=Streptomyces xanthophaeus TaxID=67385 RepID=UPI00370F92B1